MATDIANDSKPSNFCRDFGILEPLGDDLIEILMDTEWDYQRATYSIELKTKRNPDISSYLEWVEDIENAEKEVDDYWHSQLLARMEVVYTDVGPLDYTCGEDERDKSVLYEKVASNWLTFMGCLRMQ